MKFVLSEEVRDIFKKGGGQPNLGQAFAKAFASALVSLDIS